jgi:hypothetical protein
VSVDTKDADAGQLAPTVAAALAAAAIPPSKLGPGAAAASSFRLDRGSPTAGRRETREEATIGSEERVRASPGAAQGARG